MVLIPKESEALPSVCGLLCFVCCFILLHDPKWAGSEQRDANSFDQLIAAGKSCEMYKNYGHASYTQP